MNKAVYLTAKPNASRMPPSPTRASAQQVRACLLCRLLFTSPLHRASFLHRHYSGKCIKSVEWTVDELITRAVERMDPEILHKTESLGSSDRRLERCWQMELYRVILDCLPHGRVVSPDVGRVCAPHCVAPLSAWNAECFHQPELYLPRRHWAVEGLLICTSPRQSLQYWRQPVMART